MPDESATAYEDVFDTTHYTTSLPAKLGRAARLAGRYYLHGVPRYLAARRRLGLDVADLGVLANPAREFRRRRYTTHQLPTGYPDVLGELRAAGVRVAMPRLRLEGLLGGWWAARDVAGEVIELGAYRGATALVVAALGRRNGLDQTVFVADTFTGIPAAGEHDVLRRGGQYAPEPGLVDRIGEQSRALGVEDRVEVLAGLFADTLPGLERRDVRLAFAHVDANVYEGTRDACAFALPRLSAGGIVVFDDYNGVLDLGARLAIDECLAGSGLRPEPLAWCSAYARAP